MQYTNLGRTGARVSRVVLGTMNFGWHTDEETSRAVMNAAVEAGINFFDTADAYGKGRAEEIIGRWFADDPSRRDRTFLATKLFIPMGEGPNDRGLSALHIRRACEDSLRRLRTDHIDLYQFHHIDRSVSFDELWEATERLVRDGKIIYAGSSNFAGWDIATAQAAAHERHLLGLVSEQSVYNLLERTIELEVIPAARHYGLGLLPWSPLAGGLLAGAGSKTGRRGDGSSTLGQNARIARMADGVRRIRDYEALAADLSLAPQQLALAWLLSRPAVTAPVLGPRTVEQLTTALPALDVTLSEEAHARLEELFPGPGAAPEAYTW